MCKSTRARCARFSHVHFCLISSWRFRYCVIDSSCEHEIKAFAKKNAAHFSRSFSTWAMLINDNNPLVSPPSAIASKLLFLKSDKGTPLRHDHYTIFLSISHTIDVKSFATTTSAETIETKWSVWCARLVAPEPEEAFKPLYYYKSTSAIQSFSRSARTRTHWTHKHD